MNLSSIAIGSDLWTSKNSVIGFAGLVVFFIDDTWSLIEIPLNLLTLDGDHSGARAAKLIYNDLKARPTVLEKLGE